LDLARPGGVEPSRGLFAGLLVLAIGAAFAGLLMIWAGDEAAGRTTLWEAVMAAGIALWALTQ
jgi:hypothetical protein